MLDSTFLKPTHTALFLQVLCVVLFSAMTVHAQEDAEPATKNANQAVLKALPFSDTADFKDAKRGFIATMPQDFSIKSSDGRVVWSLKDYAFLTKREAPPTVDPSLWRQARLNLIDGLFKVTDRIYQVRGFDLSNITVVEGDNGLIIIDPLTSTETARAAMDLYYQHRPKKPVVAVIYTHSHPDHYAGVKGIVSEADVKAGNVEILAPEGFLEHAASESMIAGNAMSRRATYMYGALLPKSERGQVDAGLGKTNAIGEVTLIPPTDTIRKTGEKRTIDGLDIVFQVAPDTEAPAEMLLYFPQLRALSTAEDATHTLHNLYTLRGAQVRDAVAWWKALNETVELFGDKTQVVFASHHWPMWGQEKIVTFIEKQRDTYKYIHDQSVRLLNQGYTMNEIAETVELPPSLANEWFNRGYYGTVSHDTKAVYQKYMGWYDSNPANLEPLPPVEAARRYVDFMGGESAVIAKARESYAKGEYRWVAQVMNHVIFANPQNMKARNLGADALEQLGYQAESGPWRNEYLMGAYELRNGVPQVAGAQSASPDAIRAMTIELFLDYLGVRLNGPKANGKTITLNLNFTDLNERYAVALENSVLMYTPNKQFSEADATVTLTRSTFNEIVLGETTLEEAVKAGQVTIDGNAQKLPELLSLLDSFEPMFKIVTP